jgi:UDP-3-O-[3-hydroxymyristoyl] glucosamine N-acyltransferase
MSPAPTRSATRPPAGASPPSIATAEPISASAVTHAAATITIEPTELFCIARSSRMRAMIGTPQAASAAASAMTNAPRPTSSGFQPPASTSSGAATSASANIEPIVAPASRAIAPARSRIGAGSIVRPTSSM